MSIESTARICDDCVSRIDAEARWPAKDAHVRIHGACDSCGKAGAWQQFAVGFLGDSMCTDCLCASECYTHNKETNLYPRR